MGQPADRPSEQAAPEWRRCRRSLAAPFPQARFIPTGGIADSHPASYLADPAVLAVGGSWMATVTHLERTMLGDTVAFTNAPAWSHL
ncbi:hypothetical protein [Nocardia fusca]|uniref:Uncharacterized protein n=1 Tax=Nocardia fusca TaxID=941183 RepID=A0ABV3F4J3_9NOCA